MKRILMLAFVLVFSLTALAQRPPGGGPEMMLEREKQALYSKVDDLSEDQKLLIDGIYEEFGVTLKETFQKARESGSREGMREKFMSLREEKDGLIKDVLNEDQFLIYQSIAQDRRERRRPQSQQEVESGGDE